MYKQCRLVKTTNTGKLYQVSWIPSQFAKVGKVLQLKNSNTDTWDSGWIVESAGEAHEFDELDRQRDAQKRWANVLDED